MRERSLRIFLDLCLCGLFAACVTGDNYGIIGERCDGSTGIFVCKAGLVCAHDGSCQDPGSGVVGPVQEGETCAETDDCGYGLVCGPGNKCTAGGVSGQGDMCSSSEDCVYRLVCGSNHACTKPGGSGVGEACLGDEICSAGLVCAGDGNCQDPDDPDATGVAGPGEACAETPDCRLGLICDQDGSCRAPELWQGADCSASAEDEKNDHVPFKAYFEMPRDGQAGEFYRLPFPNDIRMQNGHPNLAGHPVPNTPTASRVVTAYIDAIEGESTGFSTQGTIFMRFSKWVDFASVKLGGDDANFFLVDIDSDSPNYGLGTSISMFATTARGAYICQNWMAIKPMNGYPLRPATTYALIATDGIVASGGETLTRDDDFEPMLAADTPADQTLLAAWQAYQSLRDYLADGGRVDPSFGRHVMGAAVFTTMDPESVLSGFRDKIRDCSGSDCNLLPDPTPAALALIAEHDSFYLLGGTVAVPVFQKGEAPYLEQGGGIDFDPSGQPAIQRSESVSFELSVPKGAPPAGGWPLVLYAHGTGGGPDSFVTQAVAEKLAEAQVPLGSAPQTVHLAVLGIEAVQHGDRRGGSTLDPDVLYFNLFNPQAAKYNAVQGAADNFQLVRLVEALHDLPPTVSGVPDPVSLDPQHILYFGHSQGSLTGPLFLAFSPAVKTAVLSGAGGNLIQSLLTKTQPLDIAGLTRLMLGDPDVGSMHPVLNLMQIYFDPVDVVNYGRDLTYAPRQVGETLDVPPEPIYAGPKNILQSFGRDDHFSTEPTLAGFARSMWLLQVDSGSACECGDEQCDLVDDDGLHTVPCSIAGLAAMTPPVRANAGWQGQNYTAVLKMYLPDGYDGHFVLFEHPRGPADYAAFLGSAILDPEGIPTLFP
ncbi:MAG TPA: hypothetical protein VM425_08370 [Myxococcota bacterium]|nr:hypothetical protein [Myxococcota bacterium]